MKYLIPSNIDYNWWTVTATPVFFLFFIGVCFWVYHRRHKEFYKNAGELPLNDEEK